MTPISPENALRYPAEWPVISRRIRKERALDQCECDGRCGRVPHDSPRCEAIQGGPSRVNSASIVVLTVAHLDHNPEHSTDDNLLAMCQMCHLAYDAQHHAETRAASRIARAASLAIEMPTLDGLDLSAVRNPYAD